MRQLSGSKIRLVLDKYMISQNLLIALKQALALSESSNSYSAVYPRGSYIDNATAIGKYQFTPATIRIVAAKLNSPAPSNLEFLNKPELQEKFMDTLIQENYLDLERRGLLQYVGAPITGQKNK